LCAGTAEKTTVSRTPIASLAIALLLALACGSDPQSPEAQIEATLGALEQAAEAGDASAFKRHISERYRDEQGHDRRALMAFTTIHLMQHQQRHLVVRVRSLEIRERGKAEVTLHAGLAGRAPGRLQADVYKLDLDLEDEGSGDWRVVWAQWRPVPAADLL